MDMNITRRKAMLTMGAALVATPVLANPIVDFDKDKIVVFGKKTLERKPTALDRVSIRRLLFYIEKRIRNELRCQSIDPAFSFVDAATLVMRDVKERGGVSDYDIYSLTSQGDSSSTWTIKGYVGIKPIRSTQWIDLEVTVEPHRESY